MKLQLDTKNKTVKVEENVNLEEFLKVMKKMFLGDTWKEFTLETNTIINYSPWIPWYYEYPFRTKTDNLYPWYEYTTGGIDLDTGRIFTLEMTEGIYNINATF